MFVCHKCHFVFFRWLNWRRCILSKCSCVLKPQVVDGLGQVILSATIYWSVLFAARSEFIRWSCLRLERPFTAAIFPRRPIFFCTCLHKSMLILLTLVSLTDWFFTGVHVICLHKSKMFCQRVCNHVDRTFFSSSYYVALLSFST